MPQSPFPNCCRALAGITLATCFSWWSLDRPFPSWEPALAGLLEQRIYPVPAPEMQPHPIGSRAAAHSPSLIHSAPASAVHASRGHSTSPTQLIHFFHKPPGRLRDRSFSPVLRRSQYLFAMKGITAIGASTCRRAFPWHDACSPLDEGPTRFPTSPCGDPSSARLKATA